MQRHQQNGGSAAPNNPSSLIDRLLAPMFSMGFSNTDHFRGGRIGFSVKEGCIKLSEDYNQEEEVDNSSIDYCNKNVNRNGENPNLSCKRRENKLCARGHWKPSEDARLRELVAVYGPQNWNLIAEKLQGRSGKSCRLRWYNQLDPKINKTAFTEEEEERLMEAHSVYGNKWAFISRLFPGRTDNSVKNHWHVLMARKYREKSKSYMKNKWITSQKLALDQPTVPMPSVSQLQNHFGEQFFMSNYDTPVSVHGKPYSPISTSQISFAAPVSPSPTAADQYPGPTRFLESTTATPKFIDFLGVGAIRI